MRQVVEALCKAVHGRRGVDEMCAPLVPGDEFRERLHFCYECGNEGSVWRWLESSAAEASFRGSGITETNVEKREEDEEP